MLGFDEVRQPDAGQLFPDAGDVDAQRIVVHIELVVPEEVHDVVAGADLPSVLEKVVKNLGLIFGQFKLLPTLFNGAAFQMQSGTIPDKYFRCLRSSSSLSQK